MLDLSISNFTAVSYQYCDICFYKPINILEVEVKDNSDSNYNERGTIHICETCLKNMVQMIKELERYKD